MTSLPDSTLVLVGLSGSGKTNFIVGLDVVLDDQASPDGLVHSGLAEDRAYLQPLKEQWLRGDELLHTRRQGTPPPHHLLVKHPPTGRTAGLYLPDLAGEIFDDYYTTRAFPADFCDRLESAGGLLLFLHCDHNADHPILSDPGLMDASGGTGETPPPAVVAPPWNLQDASRQTKLVDLLQFVEAVRPGRKLRIAVVLSAWDLVKNLSATSPGAAKAVPQAPELLLARNWPLLAQFLESRSALFPFRTFGVSARGGGHLPADVSRLTAIPRPRDRIVVVDGEMTSSDLTRPVRWLLNLPESGLSE